MRKSSLLGHVIEVFDEIRKGRQPADVVMAAFFRARHYLGSKDRRFIAEFIYGIVRNRRFLETLTLAVLTRKGIRMTAERLPAVVLAAAYESRLLKAKDELLTPDYEGFWRMTGFDLSFSTFLQDLHQTDLPPEIAVSPAHRLAVEQSLPDLAVEEWIARFGMEEGAALCRAMNQAAPITIRVNTLLCTVEQCAAALEAEGVPVTRTRYSPVGLILSKRVNVQALAPFRKGWFEMQDEGSQLISMLVAPKPGMTVVDACAGGGGKTLHLAALMENKGQIMATDVEPQRLVNLASRATRAEAANIIIVQPGESLAPWQESADVVLVDAPCTGSGTFRRNPAAKGSLSQGGVQTMQRTQEIVLEDAAHFVRPGGRLVYATCSLLREENEEVVERFLQRHPGFSTESAVAVLQSVPGIHLPDDIDPPYLLLLPNRTGTDGFFAATLKSSSQPFGSPAEGGIAQG